MNRVLPWLLIIGVIVAVILGGRSLLSKNKQAALTVNTTPKASLFFDGEFLGQTPYVNKKLKAGEYILKIVPESSGQALSPWEGRVNLTPGIMTVVNRELGLTQDTSSGEILSFEKIADKNAASIAVVTTPDGAVISLDGEPKGFAPLSLDGITEGEHTMTISSPGYKEKTIKARAVNGYKLIASIQLAREPLATTTVEATEEATESATTASPSPSPNASLSPSPSPQTISGSSDLEKPYVQINSEATGWVRVRKEPSTASDELAKVDHGDQFPLLGSENGWYEIEYETGSSGWISGQYAEKYE